MKTALPKIHKNKVLHKERVFTLIKKEIKIKALMCFLLIKELKQEEDFILYQLKIINNRINKSQLNFLK